MARFDRDFITPCCNSTDSRAYCGAVPTRWFEHADGESEAFPLCVLCAYDATRADLIVLVDRDSINESLYDLYEPKPRYGRDKHQFDAKRPTDPCRVCLESIRSARHHKTMTRRHFETIAQTIRKQRGVDRESAQANARLIAAAPKLLKALVKAEDALMQAADLAHIGNDDHWMLRAMAEIRAAIEEATSDE